MMVTSPRPGQRAELRVGPRAALRLPRIGLKEYRTHER
jgi:hypothetical protein